MPFSNSGINLSCMHYVNGAKTMFGNGVMRRVIVGEYQGIFIRISLVLYSLFLFPVSMKKEIILLRTWERIVWIAQIQAKTWMYSGPYGYGDMDMLGTPLPHLVSLNC